MSEIWRTKDGRVIPIDRMDRFHLMNVYCMGRLAGEQDIRVFDSEDVIPKKIVNEIHRRGLQDEVEEYWKTYRVMRS